MHINNKLKKNLFIIFIAILLMGISYYGFSYRKRTAIICPASSSPEKSLTAENIRLASILAKAKEGKDITVVGIGGSITEGYMASGVENRWINLVGKWWGDKFPSSKITVVNLGVSGTGSDLGVFRFDSEIAKYSPDVVFIEFAVNDNLSNGRTETIEGLVLKAFKLPSKPAVFLVSATDVFLKNNEEAYIPVVQRYCLPMISMKQELKKIYNAPVVTEMHADLMHPNDKGHKLIADLVINRLEAVLASPLMDKLPKVLEAPKAERPNPYEYATLLNAENTEPIINNGWGIDGFRGLWYGLWWGSGGMGNVLEFEIEGKGVGILYHVDKDSNGKVRVYVDDKFKEELSSDIEDDAGARETVAMLETDLTQGKHKIKIESVGAGDFSIKAILVSGATGKSSVVTLLEIPNSVTIY